MRSIVNSLILLTVLAGPIARAGAAQGPATTSTNDDVLGMPSPEPAGTAGVERKTVLKFHPLPAIGGTMLGVLMLPMELEYAVSPGMSVYALGSPLMLMNSAGGGFALNGGLRGYFSGTAPDGFWLGAQVGVTNISSSFASVTSFDLQPQIGYQWVFENGFSIGLGVGVSIPMAMNGQLPLTFALPLGFAW